MGYIAIQATDKFQSWYDSIKDKVAKRAIDLRITRIAAGLFGDVKRIGKISEIRVDVGPGYRVYFVTKGATLIILLAGGDKRTQQEDIRRATRMAEELEENKNV